MLRKFLTIFLLLSLSSCGFQLIYKENDQGSDISYTNELAAIRIQKNRTRINQQLQNNLYDIINPDYIKVEPKYLLTLTLNEVISPTFITITGSSGRNKITLNVAYVLKNLSTAETISEGHTSVNDNYDVSSNRYGSYTAENYVRTNLTKIAAQNTRNSLVNDFIELKKKCDQRVKAKDKEFVCPLNK